MSDTFRNINKVDKAGQKNLWVREGQAKQKAGNMKVTGDKGPNKSMPKKSLKSKSLNS